MAKYDANLTLIVNGDFNILEENKLSFGEKLRQVYTSGLFEDDLVASVQVTTFVFPINIYDIF